MRALADLDEVKVREQALDERRRGHLVHVEHLVGPEQLADADGDQHERHDNVKGDVGRQHTHPGERADGAHAADEADKRRLGHVELLEERNVVADGEGPSMAAVVTPASREVFAAIIVAARTRLMPDTTRV